MRIAALYVAVLICCGEAVADVPKGEQEVRQAIQSFYAAFNAHKFDRVEEFTVEDWNHINPLGGWTRGRNAVLRELNEVHSTFLKGVSDVIETLSIRLATPDTAVATVVSQMSSYTLPDGTLHENEKHIRTFVLVKRAGRWRIVQDQNTTITR